MKQQLRIFFLYLLVTSPLLSDGPEVPDVQKIIDQAIAGTSASQPLTPPEAIIIQPEEIKTVLLQDIATVEQGKVPKEFEQVKTPEPFKQIKIIKNGTDTLLVGVGSSDGSQIQYSPWCYQKWYRANRCCCSAANQSRRSPISRPSAGSPLLQNFRSENLPRWFCLCH